MNENPKVVSHSGYNLDLYLAFIIRTALCLGIVILVAMSLGGCSRTANGPPPVEIAAIPEIAPEGSATGSWNSQPQGGNYEKSNRAPCGPLE
jgi:hypothetical protein